MELEGLDSKIIDSDETARIAVAADTRVNISDHPKYKKFFNMLESGVSKDTVKQKMRDEGLDDTLLDDPSSFVALDETKQKKKKEEEAAAKAAAEAAAPAAGAKEMVSISDHPKYSKYFKMLKVGGVGRVVMIDYGCC